MKSSWIANALGSPPSAPSSFSAGYPTDGDPLQSIPPTEPGAWWYHMITQELQYIVLQAGLDPDPTNLTQVRDAILAIVAGARPVGQVVEGYWAAAPSGTVHLNGQLISRTTYSRLFNHANTVGLIVSEATWAASAWTMFGAGDGATTFRVPNLTEEFIRGLASGRSLGSWQDSDNKAHTHGVNDPGHTHSYQTRVSTGAGGPISLDDRLPLEPANTGSATTGISIVSSGGTESRPRNVALMRCMYF